MEDFAFVLHFVDLRGATYYVQKLAGCFCIGGLVHELKGL